MTELHQSGAYCRQVSGIAPDGANILSVLLKRTYAVGGDGRLRAAPEQIPLVTQLRVDEKSPRMLEADIDVYPFKVATDVVVTGHAYAYEPRPQFAAGIQLGTARKTFAVFGDRRCALGHDGRVLISPPDPVEAVPLRYDLAYGGRDTAASSKYGNPYDELRKYLAEPLKNVDANVYDYPRNPAGRGFIVEATREALDGLHLPNLEDRLDPLTPERLAAGTVGNWPLMPLPQGLGWVDPGWFPRIAYFGLVPDHDPQDQPVAEVSRGFAPSDVLQSKPVMQKFDFRSANGASLGLQLPFLNGDEELDLRNLHPTKPAWKFRLPGRPPRLWTDGRKGTFKETRPVVHAVIIEPDVDRVAIVWRGAAPALRPYMDEELEQMPLRAEFD
jgi:hypothetical protein